MIVVKSAQIFSCLSGTEKYTDACTDESETHGANLVHLHRELGGDSLLALGFRHEPRDRLATRLRLQLRIRQVLAHRVQFSAQHRVFLRQVRHLRVDHMISHAYKF